MKTPSSLVLITVTLLASHPGRAETLWQLGAPDNDYHEFALAGRFRRYLRTFPHDVKFVIGVDAPGRSWPYIQPGPADVWAGRRTHPFRIQFDLQSVPSSGCRLTLDFVNTHWGQPPLLEIDVNGLQKYRFQTPAGAADRALTDPSAGREYVLDLPFPPTYLRSGANRITLTSVAGSWVLYDMVRLECGKELPTTPVATGVTARCTPLFRREGGVLRQAVQVTVNNTGIEGEAQWQLRSAHADSQHSHAQRGQAAARHWVAVSLAPGVNTFPVLVTPFRQSHEAVLAIRVGDIEKTATFTERPARRWKVFIVPCAHTDIGYTDWQERTFDRHNANTARAVQTCAADPGFKWNLEVAHQAYLFRGPWARPYWHEGRRAGPENPTLLRGDFDTLVRLVRRGRIGIGGFYLNMLTGLCSGEELVRVLTRGQALSETYGFRIASAHLNDVPSATGTLPMLLRQCGIKYFSDAVNQTRGPVFRGAPREIHQAPFWWEGLDGSRVLAVFTRGYAQASGLGVMSSVDTLTRRLPGWLEAYDRADYPADAVLVYGAASDNQPLNTRYAEVVARWNARWDYPKIILARGDEFFGYVAKNFAGKLPVYRGDMGSYWEDGAGSSARETSLVRHARTRLEIVERWRALTRAHRPHVGFPVGSFDRAWDQVLFYDEHTWGAHCSISQPDSEQTRRQWVMKSGFATGATDWARALSAGAFERLFCPAPNARSSEQTPGQETWSVTAANGQSWPRDIVVTTPTPASQQRFCVRDERTGQTALAQISKRQIVFVAKDIPSLGYARFRLEPGPCPPASPVLHRAGDQWTWRTNRFILRFDPATGAVVSLRDRRSDREWVNTNSGYGLNQFLYILGGNGTALIDWNRPLPKELSLRTHTSARIRLLENGPVRAVLYIERRGDQAPSVFTWFIVLATGRLDIVNIVHKSATVEKEAGYFAFPFHVNPAKTKAFVELPYGIVQVEKEQMPGGCREWYSANTFAAVSDGRSTACLATPDAPLLTVNDVFRGKWNQRHNTLTGTLFSYAFNNYWFTNYKASQGGDLVFAYSLRLSEGDFDPTAATRFGWEIMDEFACGRNGSDAWGATRAALRVGQRTEPPECSFLSVTGGRVVVGGVTWRKGRLLVRLYNPSPQSAHSQLRFPHLRLSGAWQTDLIGRVRRRLPLLTDHRGVRLIVPARGIETTAVQIRQ